jgi:hypothetical protein
LCKNTAAKYHCPHFSNPNFITLKTYFGGINWGKFMEQCRSLLRIFIIIMIVGFVEAFLIYSQPLLVFPIVSIWGNIDMQIYSNILSLIIFIINPISVLIGFYYLGKKLDLKSNLKSVIIRLLIGAYLGQFFAITIVNLFSFSWTFYLINILSTLFLVIFFPAFTALAIAYLGNNREEPNEP